MQCPICISESNNLKKCVSCDFACCLSCLKNYILNNGKEYIDCMQCKVRFNRGSLVSIFGRSFLQKAYVDYQKQVLYKRYLLIIPVLQDIAERYRSEITNPSVSAFMQHNISREAVVAIQRNRAIKTYIGPCMTPNCAGYRDVRSFCGICRNTTCEECLEVKGRDHVCDEAKRESVRVIRAECKECPKCYMRIFKIDGCNQMFCTRCNVVFDWRSGLIETTQRIHNPHYFEYLRTIHGNRDIPQNIGCNDHATVMGRLRSALYITKAKSPAAFHKLQRLFELYHVIYDINSSNSSDLADTQNRLAFTQLKHILLVIDRRSFLIELHRLHKSMEHNQEIRQLTDTLTDVIIDKLSTIVFQDNITDVSIEDIEQYVAYTNASYIEICRLYYQRKRYDPLITEDKWNGSHVLHDWLD